MALLTLDDAKGYLRVDSADEDAMIGSLLSSAGRLCMDVARLTEEQWAVIDSDAEESEDYDPEEQRRRGSEREPYLRMDGLLLVLGHGDGQRQERRGIRRSGHHPGGGSAGFHAALFFGNGGDQLQAIPSYPGGAHIRHNQY